MSARLYRDSSFGPTSSDGGDGRSGPGDLGGAPGHRCELLARERPGGQHVPGHQAPRPQLGRLPRGRAGGRLATSRRTRTPACSSQPVRAPVHKSQVWKHFLLGFAGEEGLAILQGPAENEAVATDDGSNGGASAAAAPDAADDDDAGPSSPLNMSALDAKTPVSAKGRRAGARLSTPRTRSPALRSNDLDGDDDDGANAGSPEFGLEPETPHFKTIVAQTPATVAARSRGLRLSMSGPRSQASGLGLLSPPISTPYLDVRASRAETPRSGWGGSAIRGERRESSRSKYGLLAARTRRS